MADRKQASPGGGFLQQVKEVKPLAGSKPSAFIFFLAYKRDPISLALQGYCKSKEMCKMPSIASDKTNHVVVENHCSGSEY